MPRILNIETATQVCSVALSDSGRIEQLRESREKNAHSTVITVFIDEIMKASGLDYSMIDAVAVSMGPGSYTGLRIGVSTAKGICYALDKPLIAISTLEAMAAGMRIEMASQLPASALLCPMIDAKRMEVYCGLYDLSLHLEREIKAEIITGSSFSAELADHEILFAGDGAQKCRPVLGNHPHAIFLDDFQPSATHMAALAEEKFIQRSFEDVAYFEPYYLKDFIPGIPKVKGLNFKV
jgi:tRNA threonylcarbamoyladenosine biosynthesis protein TsaB